jgi:hypothetical protein
MKLPLAAECLILSTFYLREALQMKLLTLEELQK